MKGVNIFLADGFEDIEALGTNDVLIRAGVQTTLYSMNPTLEVKSSHGVVVKANAIFDNTITNDSTTNSKDFMIFPGGLPGSQTLADNTLLISMMKDHYRLGGSVAAICAAPGLVLSQLGEEIWRGLSFTCYDGFQDFLISLGAIFSAAPTESANRIITARSAGYCLDFGLKIIENFKGHTIAQKVYTSMFLSDSE